ncbi:hypothetical protein EJB05_02641, partial [Eragrostis curvula]
MSMLVVLPVVLLVLLPPVEPSPPWQHCGSSGNYTAGSQYEANLQLLATTLPSNASSSPDLFAKATAGEGPDQVFALALCRGDATAAPCLDCETRAFRDAQSLCPYSKEAAIYGEFCIAFFSGDDFLSSTANLGQIRLYNVSRNNSSPTSAAGAEFVTLVRALLSYSMQWAVYNSTAIKWYATVRMSVVTPALYSMMQCTPDMSGAECLQCLQDLVGNSTFNASTAGVRNLGVRCSYRYEIYQFYSGKTMLNIGSLSQIDSPPPGPPLPPLAPTGEERSDENFSSHREKDDQQAFDSCHTLATDCRFIGPYILFCVDKKNKSKMQKKGTATREEILKLWRIEESDSEFTLFDFDQIKEATCNFSERNKLGEGGFGSVYKGQLPNGLEIAVKRLAAHSTQDDEMNPKISDFGLAKICSTDIPGNTKRVVGTYGYMAPEYASEGCFSVKSDVFSYGVLILEIISGKRNAGFHQCGDFFNLLGYAWQLWKDENWLELVAPSIASEGKMIEIKKCIKIALLCVQENAADRPTMSDVVTMLSSELQALPEPKQPAFFNVSTTCGELSTTTRSSVNDLTITLVNGR